MSRRAWGTMRLPDGHGPLERDLMIMTAHVLRRYTERLLELEQIDSIRIGTKSLAYWAYKFATDNDADERLRLFSDVVSSGRDQ
ncbi:hypothetical protein [Streptomyces coeruleorubidus]|uniref:hypothetical protein n=1 Tax=Streptomyces coeruleorubidus TaxID=116188 RepID=UPI0033A9F763